jgi:hypothetical protein
VSFRPEDEERGSRLPAERKTPSEEGRRPASSPGRRLALLVGVLLLLALVIGAVLLWRSSGDQDGGTSVDEKVVETGPEPIVRLTNGPGRVSVEGVEGLESVEISAKRYARGRNPTAARENAAAVPVNLAHDDENSVVDISSEGGGGTGVDYELRVPPGSAVEIESTTGDVDVSGLTNNATILAESGDVSVSEVQGNVAIEAPQGDVAVDTIGAETGSVDITVGAGDVELEDLIVGIMETRVEAGDVTLSGRFSGSGRVSVGTGDINVLLPPEDTNDLVFETLVGERFVREDEE